MADDLDLDNDLLDDAAGGVSGSGSGNSAPPKAPTGDDKGEKRVNDLMSKWQAEQARANKLEQELAAARAGKPADSSQAPKPEGGDAQATAEFVEFARSDARRRIYESDPRLAAYGLDAEAISGSTLEEMKASFARQKALIDGIESRARAAVLQEHGLNPEIVAGDRERAVTVEKMSDAEFAKFLEERDSHKYG